MYIPPTANDNGDTNYTMQVDQPTRTIKYGISIGTRIKVRIETGATNVQPGYVQFRVLHDVVGTKRTLSAGAILFGRMTAVRGSQRLFGTIVHGISKSKTEEFSVHGNIFGADGQPGLVATVISDGHGLQRATDAGLAALGNAAIQAIPSRKSSTTT